MTSSRDGRDLAAYLLLPDGNRPFPALVFNHGSGGLVPEVLTDLSEPVRLGCAVVSPMCRGQNGNPGPFWRDLVTGEPEEGETTYRAIGRQLVKTLTTKSDDVLAATDSAAFERWLGPYAQDCGGKVLVNDADGSYGGVAAELGLEYQLCRAQRVPNSDADAGVMGALEQAAAASRATRFALGRRQQQHRAQRASSDRQEQNSLQDDARLQESERTL